MQIKQNYTSTDQISNIIQSLAKREVFKLRKMSITQIANIEKKNLPPVIVKKNIDHEEFIKLTMNQWYKRQYRSQAVIKQLNNPPKQNNYYFSTRQNSPSKIQGLQKSVTLKRTKKSVFLLKSNRQSFQQIDNNQKITEQDQTIKTRKQSINLRNPKEQQQSLQTLEKNESILFSEEQKQQFSPFTKSKKMGILKLTLYPNLEQKQKDQLEGWQNDKKSDNIFFEDIIF